MPKKKKIKDTELIVVLDRSGSMGWPNRSKVIETISGFNVLKSDQLKLPGKVFLTLIQFDDKFQVDYDGVELSAVPDLNEETYIPRGSTKLLDAVGKTLAETKERLLKNKDRLVLFVVITDGGENASTEYSRKQVFNIIEDSKKLGWEFIFVGSDPQTFRDAGSMGVSVGTTVAFADSGGGTRAMYGAISKNVSNYRSSGGDSGSLVFSDEDRQKLMNPDKDNNPY